MQLLGLASSAIEEQPSEAHSAEHAAILPTLFGEGYGFYATCPSSFVLSFLAHILAIIVLLT